ncbi:cilia- and flagella-associated protein 61 [Vanacampus margaritifer]
MKNTITSSRGQVARVTVRRSECADAEAIEGLISPEALELFGPIDVLQVLEKANLAVTLADEEGQVVAHASFFDHPAEALVDTSHWETFLCKHFKADALTPWNTLFLHLFVSQTDFSTASFQHILSAVFDTTAELEFVCLLSSTSVRLEAALEELLEPLERLPEEAAATSGLRVSVCHRRRLCPRLFVRPARVEDHDDVMHIVAQQTKILTTMHRPYFLSELIEAQDENNHAAVCECDGTITGFVSVTAEVDVRRLQEHFNLKHFGGLCKAKQDDEDEADPHPDKAEKPPQEPQKEPLEEPLEETDSEGEQESQEEDEEEVLSSSSEETSGEPNAFCIQFFFSEKNYEISSLDLIPYIFQVFPDLDFCIITVPTLSPDFPLLQNFLRVPPRPGSLLPADLYILHRDGLRSVKVRAAVESDRDAVANLATGVKIGRDALLQDLDLILDNQMDKAERPPQAFVADVDGTVVGTLIIKDEEDMEYIRARYNIENFIYYSHHGDHEHAQLRHFVLHRCFQHFSRHFFKETLRQARKSNLYHRVYPLSLAQQDCCVHHLDFILDCAVPVRPRRQIIYPLKELGANAPASCITDEQAPFALNLISRKLTMEPKVTVNARIVLVGASDTGLSFLEVLCFCPHLRFNNLTLISTHGFPADCAVAGVKFLSTSHAYSSRDRAQLPLRSCVAEVSAKMVAINRKSKHVVVSTGAKIPYDYLVLCTGLQYQVPCPTQLYQDQPDTNNQQEEPSYPPRYTGTVPSNLFTLNEAHDCNTARGWLLGNFVRRKDNAIVYGSSLDVFTTVAMLLRIGVRGSCIHLVLTPSQRAKADDLPPASDVTNDLPHESDVTNDVPPESDLTIDLPHESEDTIDLPHESEDTIDLPHESEDTIDLPHQSEDTIDLPHESEDTNGSSRESEDTNGSSRESEDTNGSSGESEGTNGSSGKSEGTNGSSGKSEGTNGSSGKSEGTNGSSGKSEGTNGSFGKSEGTNGSSRKSEDTNESSRKSEDTNESSRKSEDTNESSRKSEDTNESSRKSEDTNDSPCESNVTNDSPPESKATHQQPPETDVSTDPLAEIDITDDLPSETDVTIDPTEIDDIKDSPLEIEITTDSQTEIDDTKDSPREDDVTHDLHPESEVLNGSPPESDDTNESPSQIDVTSVSVPVNDTSTDSLTDNSVTNDTPSEPSDASDPLPISILSNEPTSDTSGLYFSDAEVESAVMAAMKKAQVNVHHGCLLMQMNNGDHPDPLTSVTFSTASEPLHLSCGVFINLSSRGVDYDAFNSINSAFLVFDGRLVIDDTFRTNDAAIWGAGPLTKFSRSYYSDEWSHANFNSKEVGQELAAKLLMHFDPTLEAPRETLNAKDRLVPIYNRPKIQGAKLPGLLRYLHVTKPIASSPQGSTVGLGYRIVTGRPQRGNYFCLHLDRNQVVKTLTCLSSKSLPVNNLICLYGKHQQLLGQLLVRLHLQQINDLYSFFRQSWCLAIFHDRFSYFEEELLQGDVKVDSEEFLSAPPRDLMKDPSSNAALRVNAAKYLSFNRNLLPMFLCPGDL